MSPNHVVKNKKAGRSGGSAFHIVRRIVSLSIFAGLAYWLFSSQFETFFLHPLFMTLFATGTLPEVISTVAALKQRTPLHSRSALVDRHQFATFLLQVSGSIGFGCAIYVKHGYGKPHFETPHGFVGGICGGALIVEVVVGAVLRYVVPHGGSFRKVLVGVHGLLSATIAITTIMAFMGGMLATPLMATIIPSEAIRFAIAGASPLLMLAAYLL